MFGEAQQDPDLTDEAKSKVALLTNRQLEEIDAALLANANKKWCKVAKLVAVSMEAIPNVVPGIPDIFYAQRIRKLVTAGKLESQGDIRSMRYSEVRLP